MEIKIAKKAKKQAKGEISQHLYPLVNYYGECMYNIYSLSLKVVTNSDSKYHLPV